jgi:putative transposase
MPRDGDTFDASRASGPAGVPTDLWFSAAELAAARLPGVPNTARGVTFTAERLGWAAPEREGSAWRQRVGRGGGVEYSLRVLPLAAQARLLAHIPADEPAPEARSNTGVAAERWAWFDRQPEKLKQRCRERLAALAQIERLVREGASRTYAMETTANERGLKLKTLYEWKKLVRDVPRADWLPFLAPMHGGGRPQAEFSPDAVTWLNSLWVKNKNQRGYEVTFRLLRERAAEMGWTVPSNRTLMRHLKALPREMVILGQQGEEGLKRAHPPLRRDRSVFGALEALNGDGHSWDVFVQWPGIKKPVRPQMVAFQDVFSGKILAWRVDTTLSWHLVRLAFGDVVEKYGIPGHCWLDNGREFAAKKITGGQPNRFRFKVKEDEPLGLMTQLGVEVHWTQPYWGQSKPIERAFGDFSRDIARHPAFEGAYTGNKPTAKPENYGERAVPLDEFLRVVGSRIAEHNARPGRRSPTCQGRSFDETFAESYQSRVIQKLVPRANEAQRRLWLLAAEGVKLRGDGRLVYRDNEYFSDWMGDIAGQKVTIRFDPDALDRPMHIYSLDGRYLGEAQPWLMAGFNTVAEGQRIARARRQQLRLGREYQEAAGLIEAAELAKGQPDFIPAAPPETKLIRPVFAVHGNAALAAQPTAAEREEQQERVTNALKAQQRHGLSVFENPDWQEE